MRKFTGTMSLLALCLSGEAAFVKKANDGRLRMEELFTQGRATIYEAEYSTKAVKKHEFLVKADGSETKN